MMNDNNNTMMRRNSLDETTGEDGIPLVGNPVLQARMRRIWDDADGPESSRIRDAWEAALTYAEEKRFRRAVAGGKEALLKVGDEIKMEGGDRYGLQALFWNIDPSGDDDDWIMARLTRAARALGGPDHVRVLPLFDPREREAVRTVVERHHDSLVRVLVESTDRDRFLHDERLRDLGSDACGLLSDTIEALLDNLRTIELFVAWQTPESVRNALLALAALQHGAITYVDSALPKRFICAIYAGDNWSRRARLEALLAQLRNSHAELASRGDWGSVERCTVAIGSVERVVAEPAAALAAAARGRRASGPSPACPSCWSRMSSAERGSTLTTP